MAGFANRLSTALNLVVVLGTIINWDSAASPVYQPEGIAVNVHSSVDFRSPGFPACCDDKYIFYKVSCVPDYAGQPCYLRIVFSDVDMTPGSIIMISENRRVIDKATPDNMVHKDTWYRPVVASTTGELTLQVRLVASAGTKRHTGFRANITRTTVPGLLNWPDRPITTECPEAHSVQHGSVSMSMSADDDRIQDCVWRIRGPENCTIYAATLNHKDVLTYKVHGEMSSLGTSSSSDLVYSLTNNLYVRVRKPARTGVFEMYYGCYTFKYEMSSTSQGCLAKPIGLDDGFECASGICLSGATRCNGITECPDGADEKGCFNDDVSHGNMSPANRSTIVSCFGSALGGANIMYIFIILPLIMIPWVACVCFFCKKRKAALRRSHLGPPIEGEPPPIYQIATDDIKPERNPLASLPSYEEVCLPPDPPPKYVKCEPTPHHKGTKPSKKASKESKKASNC